MSIVYLIALAAVCVVFSGVLLEAVASVSRKPVWPSTPHTLALVETVDRREHQLPFVGQERREAEVETDSAEPALRRVG